MRRNLSYLIIVVISFTIVTKTYSQTPPPVTSIGTAVFSAGTWSVPVNVAGFVNVGNISMKLNYDASKLTYTGATVNTGLNPGNIVISPLSDQSGTFRFSYSSSLAIVMTAPTNTLLTITFTPKAGVGGVQTFLTWSTNQGDCDITPPVPATFVPVLTAGNMADYFFNGSFDLPRTLNLNFLLESIYSGGGVMNQVKGISGNQFPGTVSDIFKIELHNALTYSQIAFTSPDIYLDKSGLATLFIPSIYSGSYYITIRHRNSLTTVSAVPVSFTSATINYSFINPITKAFGSNMRSLGAGLFGLFAGDVDQDGFVGLSDMVLTDNKSAQFAFGYLAEDIDGDGYVGISDMVIIDNNSSKFIFTQTP